MSKKRKKASKPKSFKVPSKINKDKDEPNELVPGQYLGDNRIVSADRDLSTKVIIHTFIGEEEIKQPDSVDRFISNSLDLASRDTKFIPWVSGNFKNYQTEIANAISKAECKELDDSINSSGIVNLSQTNVESETLEVE